MRKCPNGHDVLTRCQTLCEHERENREMERSKLEIAFRDLGEPVVLTTRVPEGPSRQRNNLDFYRSVGMTRMPVTWEDEAQREYEVFVKGHIDMGPFANLMERVEYIGKATGALLGNEEIVYRVYD